MIRYLRSRGTIAVVLLFSIMVAALIWLFLLPPSIVIRWQTETEVDTVAFNVLRSEAGGVDFVPINRRPIPASGSALGGAAYSFTDKSVQRGHIYAYRLQEITTRGEQTTYPWQTTARAQRSLAETSVAVFVLLSVCGWWLFDGRQRPNAHGGEPSSRRDTVSASQCFLSPPH